MPGNPFVPKGPISPCQRKQRKQCQYSTSSTQLEHWANIHLQMIASKPTTSPFGPRRPS